MDANTLASALTAGGTLVLAVATFASTRSANRASRVAEKSLLANLRPVLVNAQIGDPMQKIGFADQHWVRLEGPQAAFDVSDPDDDNPAIYLAFSVRNVGSGIAILQGWYPTPQRVTGVDGHPPVEEFRGLTRSLYVPPGGVGFWQGALRDPDETVFTEFAKAAANRNPVTIDLLYTDMNGGQHTITRMSVAPVAQDPQTGQDRWFASIGKHWLLSEEA
ncbi:MAG TPA: hypothetical protein VF843_10330 [Streptosporangiaceae bacterium]